MHWFALMKDNLDVFEVLFCPVGEQQRPTRTRTHAHTNIWSSALHAEQVLLHLHLLIPILPNHTLKEIMHPYIIFLMPFRCFRHRVCTHSVRCTYTRELGGMRSNSSGRNDQKAEHPTVFLQDEIMNKLCFVLFSLRVVYMFRLIPEHGVVENQLFVDPSTSVSCSEKQRETWFRHTSKISASMKVSLRT